MKPCDNLCKYYDDDGGCVFFLMGSGNVKDMPCYEEEPKSAHWEEVKSNRNMIHCSNCSGTWWNKDFKELFKFCPECGKPMET